MVWSTTLDSMTAKDQNRTSLPTFSGDMRVESRARWERISTAERISETNSVSLVCDLLMRPASPCVAVNKRRTSALWDTACGLLLCSVVCVDSRLNRMQWETANVAPGAATWRSGQNIRVVFDSGQFSPSWENMTSSTKPKVNKVRLTLPWKEDRAIITGKMYGKFGVWLLKYESGQTDRQTDRQIR